MRYLIGILILALISAGLYFAYARYRAMYLEDGAYMTTPSFKADKVHRLETLGEDARIYEFTPRSSTRKQCVYFANNSNGGLFCFDK